MHGLTRLASCDVSHTSLRRHAMSTAALTSAASTARCLSLSIYRDLDVRATVCVCVCTKQVGFRSRGNARGLAIFYVSYMAWHVTGERSGIGTLSAHLVRESGLACLADSIIEISSRMGVLLPELERGSALAPFRPSFVVLRPSLTTSFPRWRRVPVASRPAPPLPRR